MKANANMTHFSARLTTDGPVWTRHYIYGVGWQGRTRATLSDKGLQSTDSALVFVPIDAGHFREGDIIVRGLVDAQLSGGGAITLAELRAGHENVREVMSVLTCDMGSRAMRHIELEAV